MAGSDEFLTTILEGIGEGFYAVDRDWRITLFNSAAAAHFKCAAKDVMGRVLWEVFPSAKDTPLGRLFTETMESRQTVRSETPSVVVGERWLSFGLFPLGEGIGVVFRDITDHKRAEEERNASENLFRNLAESLPHLIWVMRPDGYATYFNRRFKEYHGYEMGGDLADRSSTIHPDDKPAVWEIRDRAIAAGLPFEAEVRTRRHDGVYRWFRMGAVPLKHNDELIAYVGIAIDIHDMRIAEEQLKRHVRHQDLLINELNHRVKNTLAIIQSIARQTLRNTSPHLRNALQARLTALAGAYDVLTKESWESADLREIVASATAPFQEDGRQQFQIQGEPSAVDPATALTLAMALHELGTNAAKYGALTSEAGRVAIAWARPEPGKGVTRLEWKETGGPPVTAPTRSGFGSRLLKLSFKDAPGGGVRTSYLPDGVVCEMHIPLRLHGASPPSPFVVARAGKL